MRTTGRTGHSSGIFGEGLGYGAIYEMARILDAFRRELPEPNLTYNVGVIAGGTPATIDEAGLPRRRLGQDQHRRRDRDRPRRHPHPLRRAGAAGPRAPCRRSSPSICRAPMRSSSFAEDGYPPMAPTEGNRALLARLNAVNRDLGLPEMAEYDPARRGAADSGFVAPHVDTLGGLGAGGGGAHAEGEWVDLDALPPGQARGVADHTADPGAHPVTSFQRRLESHFFKGQRDSSFRWNDDSLQISFSSPSPDS